MRLMLGPVMLVAAIAMTAITIGLAAWSWGGLGPLLAHPARAGACLILALLTVTAFFTDFNFGHGKREDPSNDWIYAPIVLLGLLLAGIPAYADRLGLWTIDGDVARYLGLALFAIGGVLRVGPMLVLGPRFTARVAILDEHRLETSGFYRLVRHPSYLGVLLGAAGWALVFRSGIGLLLALPLVPLFLSRIAAEEALLYAEFGEAYADYRRRTWRLIPFVY